VGWDRRGRFDAPSAPSSRLLARQDAPLLLRSWSRRFPGSGSRPQRIGICATLWHRHAGYRCDRASCISCMWWPSRRTCGKQALAAGRGGNELGVVELARGPRRRQDLLDLPRSADPRRSGVDASHSKRKPRGPRPVARHDAHPESAFLLTAFRLRLVIGPPDRFRCGANSPARWAWFLSDESAVTGVAGHLSKTR